LLPDIDLMMSTSSRPGAPTGPGRALLWLILSATMVRLLMAWALGLGIDESYAVAAGRQFHLGYFDHPAAMWWLSASAAHLFASEAPIIVRLPFIAMGALSTWLLYRLTARLFSPRAGLWAAIAFTLSPVLGFTSASWVLPDGPLLAALLAATICLFRALDARGWRWWLATGVCVGLAMMSKYTAALVMAGGAIAIATQPRHRHWLGRPQPYIAALVALLIFAPQIVWNAQHHWASFAFQGGRAATARFRPVGLLATLGGEALFLLPWIWFGLTASFLRGLRAGPANPTTWLLCWLAAGPVVLFVVVSLWSRNVLFHWAAPGYLLLYPLLGAELATWRPALARRWTTATAALLVVGCLLVASEVRFHWLALVTTADPGIQALDWTPLGPALAARGLLTPDLIAGTDWANTGKIAYALGPDIEVLCLNEDAREFAFATNPRAHLGADILIVAPHFTPTQISARYGALFDTIETLPPAQLNFTSRAPIDIPLYLGHGLRRWPWG
jgi:4-amino-4-deoxy-L-arabinose transferase-like glycosyltransferase